MKVRLAKCAALLLVTFCAPSLWAGDAIPKIAWKRGIGEPLANPGTRKPQLTDLIDDVGDPIRSCVPPAVKFRL